MNGIKRLDTAMLKCVEKLGDGALRTTKSTHRLRIIEYLKLGGTQKDHKI